MKNNLMDGLKSLIGNLGNPSRDKSAATLFVNDIIPDDQLTSAYSSNWIARKIIDIPVNDSLRKWRTWNSDNVKLIVKEEKRLGVQAKIMEARKKARLLGGAAIYIGTDQEPSEPLDLNKIKKDGLKYLTVFTRKELIAGELEQDPASQYYGKPKDYQISNSTQAVTIHPSRLVIFIGNPKADIWESDAVNNGWGDSVLQSTYDSVKNANSVPANVASLVFESNVDVIKIPNFMAGMGDASFEKKVLDRFTLASAGKGINGTLVIDAEEDYQRKTVSFTQLPEIMQMMLQIAAASDDIPATRFLSQSPTGLNSTGDSDLLNYYDKIAAQQSLEIEPAIYNLDECLIRSIFGARDESIDYNWNPLKQMTAKEIADIGKTTAETIQLIRDDYTSEEVREITTHKMTEIGAFPHLDNLISETKKKIEIEPIADARPKTLYVYRKVKNTKDLKSWAESQGFTDVVNDLHVTIAYSCSPVDWMSIGEAWRDDIEVNEGGARVIERFGDEAVVLLFKSESLEWRHDEFKSAGASFDFAEYQPHITISYNSDIDISKIEPYQGKIEFGAEFFEEVDED